jgi:S1-C subfamily serine protease
MSMKTWCVVGLALAGVVAQAGVPEGVEAFGKLRYPEARKELTEPAARGDVEAMALMGDMLMRGLGGTRDELKAREYILKAYEGGSLRAMHTLGVMYLNGNLVTKDENKGVELVKKAAELRYPAAQALYGVWLTRGLYGQEKNEVVGMTWFNEAAAQNDPLAMNWLGDAYEYGKSGVVADNLVALDWYKKSAERLNASSMVSAGRIYAMGKGVTADGAEALRWFKKAVLQNNYNSYTWIANVYEFGRGGIAKSASQAYAWYLVVPANAPPDVVKAANEGKDRVAKVLSVTEVEESVKNSKTLVAQTMFAELSSMVTRPPTTPVVQKGVYGSGVVVSKRGDIVTNEHVVQGCEKVRVQPLGLDVKVVAKDAKNDLALLKLEGALPPAIKFRAGKGVRLGDELVAIGYPLRGLLSSGPIVTTGILNALSGANDDTSAFQMSATVQPGSSGGPIVDNTGALVGIVRARLLPSGPIAPQNVNFGINLSTVSGFLDAHAVDYTVGPTTSKPLSVSDITAQVQKATVQVECY